MLDALETAKAQEVGLAHVCDKAVGGLGHRQERLEVLRMAGAHLNDGYLSIGIYLEYAKRYTNIIIKVALCGRYIVFGTQHGLDELLGGGFSVGAGEADYGNIELLPVVGGQLLKGLQGVRDSDYPVIGKRDAGYGIRGAGLQSLFHEGVAVEVLPLEGYE